MKANEWSRKTGRNENQPGDERNKLKTWLIEGVVTQTDVTRGVVQPDGNPKGK